jgi:hypothetical protein
MPSTPLPDLFTHIRIVMGIVLGLGLARLLSGLARFVQHPRAEKIDLVHLGWVFSMLLMLVHFWWWEFRLASLQYWRFETYFFLVGYMALLFLLCALLFPDHIAEYNGYWDFLMSRRRWFFGILAATYACDLVDTLLKGSDHLAALGTEYPIRIAVYIVLCIVATLTTNRQFHLAFAYGGLVYQVSFILRLFETLS